MQGSNKSVSNWTARFRRYAVFFIVMMLPLYGFTEEINYCNDPNVDKGWSRLMKNNGHLPEWKAMFSLRKELCHAVEKGEISLEEATQQFEQERKIMIESLRERLEQKYGQQIRSA